MEQFWVNRLTMRSYFTNCFVRRIARGLCFTYCTICTIVYFCEIAHFSKYCERHTRSKICMTWAKVVDSNTKYVEPIYAHVNMQVVCNSRRSELKRWIRVASRYGVIYEDASDFLLMRFGRYRPLCRSTNCSSQSASNKVRSEESNPVTYAIKKSISRYWKLLFCKITRNVFRK